ncbi:MAG TPA: TonB-dependent receptor, partial [Bacteroidota bacterium]|nr:TonB-dependent receptor [Bacteroidota bacterium]
MCMLAVRLLVLALVFVAGATSQETEVDSQKTYPIGEVVVTATRGRIPLKDSPSQMDIIDEDDLQNINGGTVADALQHESSLFVKQYGPNGALRTLSMRGGASEHVLVLVDGNRVNSFQNGLVDLSLFPLNDVDRIEVLHGGSSALYGADALGGVVNILTRAPGSGLHVRTEAATGSFGLERYLIESRGRTGRIGLVAGYASERGRDDFRYDIVSSSGGDTTVTRENSDFFRRQMYLHTSISPYEHASINSSIQYVVADRGTPSPFSPSARQSDDDLHCSLGFNRIDGDGTGWNFVAGFHYALQDYNDPNPSFPYHTFYKNIYASVNPQIRLRLGEYQVVTAGGEMSQGTLDSPDFDSKVTRVQKSVYVTGESRIEFDNQLFNLILLYQSIRYDLISDVDFAVTPKAGINVRLASVGDIRLRGSIGESFRSPSFNDLYYRGFSNPALRPERSTSFDAGFSAAFTLLGENSLEYTYFHQDIDSRILFDPSTYLPMNIGKVLSVGSEVKYAGSFIRRKLDVKVNYSFTDARKRNLDFPGDPAFDRQLVYIPGDVFNASFGFTMEPLRINITHSIVGSRFLTSD